MKIISSDANTDHMLARLRQHRTLGGAPSEELAWLAAHGVSHSYQSGNVTTRKGQPEEFLQVLLAGHLAIHVDRGAGSRKIIEWRDGDVCGLMPYSRGGAPPGDTVAEELTETLAVPRDVLPAMIRACPQVTATLVHAMLDRARHFTSSDLHDEKLVSLGKLAAGLAHELNNPASAASRAAKLLVQGVVDADEALITLEAAPLTDAQREVIGRLRAQLLEGAPSIERDTLARADREEAVADWLDRHGLDAMLADTLASTGVPIDALDQLAAAVAGGALDAALRSFAAGHVVRGLAADIDLSVSRISALVNAVKGFTYLDRAPVLEAIDIRRGIDDTLVMLAAKLRAKALVVHVTFAPELPQVRAFGGELNQVWMNLIDNAIDAAPSGDHLEVSAERVADYVVVRIVDHGAGISREHLGRIFDPFFTTKGVGQGMGLGLDIVRRLVQRHDGEVEVTSRPGHTDMQVRLPVAAD